MNRITGFKTSMISEESIQIRSELLGRKVTLTLLLPLNWQHAGPLHLLLLNDGQDIPALKMKETLAHLYERDRLLPLMVAGIHAGERLQEYGTARMPDIRRRGRKATDYTRFVLLELMPFIRHLMRTEQFASVAFAGCSLGGLSALDIAWHHPEVFHKVGAFSGSFWWRNAHLGPHYNDDKHRIMHQIIRQSAERPDLRFWFQAGTLDEAADRNNNGIIDAIDDTVDLIRELEEKGYRRPDDIRYVEMVGGRHDTATWAKAMPGFLTWAFGK